MLKSQVSRQALVEQRDNGGLYLKLKPQSQCSACSNNPLCAASWMRGGQDIRVELSHLPVGQILHGDQLERGIRPSELIN